jgi:hypothetical protein
MTIEQGRNPQAAQAQARKILNLYRDQLMSKANVVGVGVGYRPVNGSEAKEIAIVVMVTQKFPEKQLSDDDLVPGDLEGIRVEVREVGMLESQTKPSKKTDQIDHV